MARPTEPDTDPREVGQRIEALLDELVGHASPEVAASAEQLAELLMDMYGAGLERVVGILAASPAGAEQLRELVADDLVSGLLVLHDLHPEDTATRADRALESVRPYLGSHAGDVELLGVELEADGPVVKLALKGSCDGCPSSAITVTTAIETAIEEACPEVVRVDVAGLSEPTPPAAPSNGKELPLLQIGSRPPVEPAPAVRPSAPVSWVVLEPPALRPGQCAVVDAAGHPVLVALPAGAHAEGGPVAYADRCPVCAGSLAGAELHGVALTCPSCSAVYNVRHAGSALAGGADHLEPLPLVRRAGGWRLALPRTAPPNPTAGGSDHGLDPPAVGFGDARTGPRTSVGSGR